jgi:hypothetical protein
MLKELKKLKSFELFNFIQNLYAFFATVNTKPLVNKAKTFDTKGFSSVIN